MANAVDYENGSRQRWWKMRLARLRGNLLSITLVAAKRFCWRVAPPRFCLVQFDLKFSIWPILLVYVAAVGFVIRAIERIRTEAAWQGRAQEREFYREHDLLKPRTDPAWRALRDNDGHNDPDPAMTEKLVRALGHDDHR